MSTKRRSLNRGTFHIRLGANTEKVDLRNPEFWKVLEQQYATKYLESLGVETSAKNIAKILKERPLESCEISENRFAGGLYTDTITIVTSSEHGDGEKQQENEAVSKEMLKILDLRKMSQIADNRESENIAQSTNSLTIVQQQQKSGLQHLDFSIKAMKNRYLFPFNENFTRKNNYRMKDVSNIIERESDQSKLIFESAVFRFPFTQIKLSLATLKQLQIPISTKLTEVMNYLERFCVEFPRTMFPIAQSKKTIRKQVHLFFEKRTIQGMFETIKSEENAKFIGVFLHLSNWIVFGGVNPIQIDASMKKKMFLMISQTMKYFELKTSNKKNWATLIQPMLILTLKMSLDYFYHRQYPTLFASEQSKKMGADELAFDKILLFVDQMLDQGSINGRFIFLESDIDGPKDGFIKDKKFIRKRIFGVSPGLHIILPEPKDGKARLMIAKNLDCFERKSEKRDGCEENENDKQCRQKLLNLTLLKIRNRIDGLIRFDANNPIIRLEDDKNN